MSIGFYHDRPLSWLRLDYCFLKSELHKVPSVGFTVVMEDQMSRHSLLFVAFIAAVVGTPMVQAQSTCRSENGKQVCLIELQNAPNNMEPVAEPTRIRVDDRSSIVLRLVNLSPLDVCSLGSRTSTPTAETNPFESIVTTISGLGGFALSGTTALEFASEVQQLTPAAPPPLIDDPKYKLFWDAAKIFGRSAQDVVDEQKKAQSALESDLTKLSSYVGADYRGANWNVFNPGADSTLDGIRSDINNALPSIMAAAPVQATADEMAGWAGDLHKSYDSKTDPDTVAALKQIDGTLAKSKATMSILSDYNAALKTAQTALRTSYLSTVKLYNDSKRLQDQKIIKVGPKDAFLMQDFPLATDRKTTITGSVSCVSDADGKTPTTDQISYSVLYQNVPILSASAGLLTTFQEKRVIGTTTTSATNPAGFNTIFAVTDSARAQVFPMAYFNWRFGNYLKTHWYKRPEDELDITTHLSAGIGVNPNTGTNQPEFFVGMALGFNKLMIHPGVHFGRTQTLGGGFTLNNVVPPGYSGPVPINWSYHPAFSIGFSVRVAPW